MATITAAIPVALIASICALALSHSRRVWWCGVWACIVTICATLAVPGLKKGVPLDLVGAYFVIVALGVFIPLVLARKCFLQDG